MEKQKLDNLKLEVNNMEYDALQRRFRRVNSTSLIPTVRSRRSTHSQSFSEGWGAAGCLFSLESNC